MVYVISVCWQFVSRSICSCSQAVSQPVWHTPLLCVQWKAPDDGQRNCPKHVESPSKTKFEKLLHLVGFILRTKQIYGIFLHYFVPFNITQGTNWANSDTANVSGRMYSKYFSHLKFTQKIFTFFDIPVNSRPPSFHVPFFVTRMLLGQTFLCRTCPE